MSGGIASLNGFHYSAAITAAILAAGIEALANISGKRPEASPLKHPRLLAVIIVVMALVQMVFYGYRPLSIFNFDPRIFIQTPHEKLLNAVITSIPYQASISAQYVIAPHFNKPYDKMKTAPNTFEESDYVLWDDKTIPALTTPERDRLYLERLQKDSRYRLIKKTDGIMVFQRIF